jgi:hypothetical protein
VAGNARLFDILVVQAGAENEADEGHEPEPPARERVGGCSVSILPRWRFGLGSKTLTRKAMNQNLERESDLRRCESA